jgi:hypothetical protein
MKGEIVGIIKECYMDTLHKIQPRRHIHILDLAVKCTKAKIPRGDMIAELDRIGLSVNSGGLIQLPEVLCNEVHETYMMLEEI